MVELVKGAVLSHASYSELASVSPAKPAFWSLSDIRAEVDSVSEPGARRMFSLSHPQAQDGFALAPEISLLVQFLSPGERTPSHGHSFWHVYTIIHGNVEVTIGEDLTHAVAGDVFYIPPWTTHELANSSDTQEALLHSLQNLPQLTRLDAYLRYQSDPATAKRVLAGNT